jgi:cellulose synthase/poly-beta-1,6-N-acetylglucosamine synthase-like glycosyltransferase
MIEDALRNIILASQIFAIVFFFAANTFYGVQVLMAVTEVRDHVRATREVDPNRLARSHSAPRISVLAPAYNEEATIVESIRALMSLNYPDLEVIVISDGSKDGTVERLKQAYQLVPSRRLYEPRVPTKHVHTLYRSLTHPNLLVADKERHLVVEHEETISGHP